MSNILVTGGLGFIGSNFISKIIDKENFVVNIISEKLISFVKDRKGHDYRYALNSSKIIKSGWNCKMNFKDSIKNTITWYLKNKSFLN